MSNKSSRRIALLGATGSTGGAILSQLLLLPPSSIHLNVYVRSPERLQELFPDLQDKKNVSIFSGSLSSLTMRPFLENADVILNAIGTNKPMPGLSLLQQTATAIVTALQDISLEKKRRKSNPKTPHLVILSSGSLNQVFSQKKSWLQRKFIENGLYYNYEDLRLATAYYSREGEKTGLLRLSAVCPGAIAHDSNGSNTATGRGEGVRLSTIDFTPMVTYPELARGMIEVAEDPDQWVRKEVLLVSAQKPAYGQLLSLIVRNVVPGFIITFVPSLYPAIHAIGWL